MLVLRAFTTAVPESEHNAGGHEPEKRQSVAVSESLNSRLHVIRFLRQSNSKIGDPVWQAEDAIAVFLPLCSGNLGSRPRNQSFEFLILKERNPRAIRLRLWGGHA